MPLPPTGPIVVPYDHKPTLFNDGMTGGMIIGQSPGSGVAGSIAGMLIGGLIGGLFGRHAMERDYMQGRVVQPPASPVFNVGISALLFGGVGLLIGATFFAAPLAVAAVAAAGALFGGYAGYRHQEARQRDYANAQAYYVRHGGNYEGREREAQKAYSVTPEEAQMLQARLAAGRVAQADVSSPQLQR